MEDGIAFLCGILQLQSVAFHLTDSVSGHLKNLNTPVVCLLLDQLETLPD
jgi:hypothetical protein